MLLKYKNFLKNDKEVKNGADKKEVFHFQVHDRDKIKTCIENS